MTDRQLYLAYRAWDAGRRIAVRLAVAAALFVLGAEVVVFAAAHHERAAAAAAAVAEAPAGSQIQTLPSSWLWAKPEPYQTPLPFSLSGVVL